MSVVVVVTVLPSAEHRNESAEAGTEHGRRPALADLLSALDGKLTAPLDVQVLTPHHFGDPRRGAVPGPDG